MGVKNMWLILSPVCDRKSLWELQGKAVAVDLSCWVCDSQNVENFSQPRLYLRNLFFRTSCLLLLGVKPVFVLEGEAPAIKHDTMSRRVQQVHGNKTKNSSSEDGGQNKGKRSRFNGILKQCEELLQVMGVPCVQSSGEAEALCAQLNEAGLVEGCITQDGDSFLYGARTVFRNLTISTGYSMEVYKMSVIEEKLSLSRMKLIALSLLCGCDYNDKGVVGVGKESALKFLAGLHDDEVIPRLRKWRSDPRYSQLEEECQGLADTCINCTHKGKLTKHNRSGCGVCGFIKGCKEDEEKTHLIHQDLETRKLIITELGMRRKALQDVSFPSEAVIDEFLRKKPLPDVDLTWKRPDMFKFIKFSTNMLCWSEEYAMEKFFPLLTRWQCEYLRSSGGRVPVALPATPVEITKKRTHKSVQCFEVKWTASEMEIPPETLVTLEPAELFCPAYPKVVEEFNRKQDTITKNRAANKKCKKKQPVLQNCTCQCKENADSLKKQGHLCAYMKPARCILGNLNANSTKDTSRNGVKQVKVKISTLNKLCENADIPSQVDAVEINFSKLSLNETKKENILDEFNSLDVDDEIANMSGIIDCIVGGQNQHDVLKSNSI